MRLGLQRVGSAGGGSGSHGRRIVSISTSLTLIAVGFPEGNPRISGLIQGIKVSESAQQLRLPMHGRNPALVTLDGHILGHGKRPRRSIVGKYVHFVR